MIRTLKPQPPVGPPCQQAGSRARISAPADSFTPAITSQSPVPDQVAQNPDFASCCVTLSKSLNFSGPLFLYKTRVIVIKNTPILEAVSGPWIAYLKVSFTEIVIFWAIIYSASQKTADSLRCGP